MEREKTHFLFCFIEDGGQGITILDSDEDENIDIEL